MSALLLEQLQNCIQLEESKKAELSQAVEDGIKFFKDFNDSRMEQAFSVFSEEMKKALFEVLFFLHVNDPKFEEHTYISTRMEKVYGVPKEVEYEAKASLYVENAPTGVVGIDELAPIFKDQFKQYIQNEFNWTITNQTEFAPIYSVASLGSIGTIGHKETASDLDLQVQYELEAFLLDPSKLTDQKLEYQINRLIQFFSKKYRITKKITQHTVEKKVLRSQIVVAGHRNVKKRFPLLYDIIIAKKNNMRKLALSNQNSRVKLLGEIISMSKLYSKICTKVERTKREQLLKERIKRIQDYVQKKFPKAEVFLFAYSNDDYRDGKHGTTLESKEASGSAYELYLNYEILMPGIQFTPMIPIHFLMPPSINSNRDKYEELIDYLRFQGIDLYDQYRDSLVDLGSTPPLTTDYMVAHSGAVYWEAFKASSGNLPKATLNLLRFEMCFDPKFNTSLIELVKNPDRLDKFAGDAISALQQVKNEQDSEEYEVTEDDFYDDYGIENPQEEDEDVQVLGEEDTKGGLSIEQIYYIESKFPKLLQDPWWLRYKALKIGFGSENDSIKDERELISRIIDLGFALHIRVSDIFGKIKESKKLESYRENVMGLFLQKAFPVSKRRYLEHICDGEVDAVISFEKDLKFIFKNSMKRVQQYVDKYGGKDQTNQDEYRIWYHYYEKNFDPPKNVVRRDILSDLKVPRGRLQMGINDKKNWFFRSIQKSSLSSSYDTFGLLDHLPEEVDLFEHGSFLHGIAHCILNGYYGVTNKGTLKESRTHLEYSVGHTEIGKASTDKYAFIRPDIVDRLFDGIDKAFPPQEYDFRDCIHKEMEIVNIFICLNLLEFGRISFMYRDNLKTWYVDEINHRAIERIADHLFHNPHDMLKAFEIQSTIKEFFAKHKVDLNKPSECGISFWVNPNSAQSYHRSDKFAKKEADLAAEFEQEVFNFNGMTVVEAKTDNTLN